MLDKVAVLLGFRIVRRGVPDSDTQSFLCERLAADSDGTPRVVSVSPAQEREFIMYDLLRRVYEQGGQPVEEVPASGDRV